jgi:hypothetical protein
MKILLVKPKARLQNDPQVAPIIFLETARTRLRRPPCRRDTMSASWTWVAHTGPITNSSTP